MSTSTRLSHVFETSKEIPMDDTSKIVFFSDCHRGDGSKADDFSPNKGIYSSALDYYHAQGYTYIEIGDGDELWENDRFSNLLNAHLDVYLQMRKFYKDGRLYMILGNHDIVKQRSRFVQKNLYAYYNPRTQRFEPLFDNIQIHEGLILRYSNTPYNIFVVHGHQGDLLNDQLWPLARFLVRYVWRHIEILSRSNPMSPARNISRMNAIESNISHWVKANRQMVIAGHTHHPVFPKPGEVPYFNGGCCIHKGYITCIEIKDGEIMLVKWSSKLGPQGLPVLNREVIAGPEKIRNFFS